MRSPLLPTSPSEGPWSPWPKDHTYTFELFSQNYTYTHTCQYSESKCLIRPPRGRSELSCANSVACSDYDACCAQPSASEKGAFWKIRRGPSKPNQRKVGSWTFCRGVPEQKFDVWIVLVFLWKNTRIHKNGRHSYELFVLALSLVWFAGATPEKNGLFRKVHVLEALEITESPVSPWREESQGESDPFRGILVEIFADARDSRALFSEKIPCVMAPFCRCAQPWNLCSDNFIFS